ncbi:RNA 2',3'-cyclic phosphodiesterase [Thalassotalea crassostreae]|uniref:RNA 2',3'-cyclic phosphodiesterase n=1 Tax=Thalassotalea crassostreae TaxID=1763536 RepID=UPI0008391728|nr:RNA 2',3'-cyclic phosphodiesterase [Thalassotalea crassostreae]
MTFELKQIDINMMRLFFGLNPKIIQKQKIDLWHRQNLNHDFANVAVDNFHITLSFLGLVDAKTYDNLVLTIDRVQVGTLLAIEPVKLTLDNLGFWKRPKILYLGVKDCPQQVYDLANFCHRVAIQNSIALNNRQYVPHLTLCRKAKYLPPFNKSIDIELSFDSFCLYQSISTEQGVKYKVLNQWPLLPIENLR